MSRGQFDIGRKALYMVIVVFALILMFFYMSALMNNYYARTVSNADRISAEIIASNLLVSPLCLAYVDPNVPRVYLGVVDFSKVVINLDSCLPYNDRPFRITLADKTLNFGLKDNANSAVLERMVLVRDGNSVFPSKMVVEAGYVR